MNARLVSILLPVLIVFVGLEVWMARRRERRDRERYYRLHDSVASASCGIGQQALSALIATLPVAAYTAVYDRLRVATIPRSPLSWIALFIAVDLLYWVYHFASHRVNVLWAIHSVHHQSEEYNLTTALQQSWLTALTT